MGSSGMDTGIPGPPPHPGLGTVAPTALEGQLQSSPSRAGAVVRTDGAPELYEL